MNKTAAGVVADPAHLEGRQILAKPPGRDPRQTQVDRLPLHVAGVFGRPSPAAAQFVIKLRRAIA